FIDDDLRQVWIRENEELGGPTPETEKKLYRNMAEVLEPVYTYLDNVVGRIVAAAPEKAIFIVISDHGFNFSTKGYSHYNVPVVPHGVILLGGPGVKTAYRLDGAKIFDVAPTLLWMFGLPVADDMDGAPLRDAFEEAFLRARPLRSLASYGRPSRREDAKKPRALDKEVLEDLKSLGYIK
ncbi:MAG: hypothetical protein ACE5LV_02450, partial [Candidatus Aminicenantales bacterium]